jgi:PleD family two-component response regulator
MTPLIKRGRPTRRGRKNGHGEVPEVKYQRAKDSEGEMRPGTRVLLVEDDRSIASFVEPELEHLGFRVRCAYDGPTGLEEVQRFRPELIVLDIMLPKLDGVGVLKKL